MILRTRTIFFLFQIQDLDLLLPIMKAHREKGREVLAWLHPFVVNNSPRVLAALEDENIPFQPLPPSLFQQVSRLFLSAAFISAADTTAKAHWPGRRLSRLANMLCVPTFTLQHGLENIGLTYFDSDFPSDDVDFASKTIFVWGELSVLDPRVPPGTRLRCVPVGCPKEKPIASMAKLSLPLGFARTVAVFENLHWGRYGDSYRNQFFNDLIATARTNPDILILLKPHHAGQWFTRKFQGKIPSLSNLIIADPKLSEWEPFTAPALIELSDGVITTPSTTAFDAALLKKPTAVVRYSLDLSFYRPLPMLNNAADWTQFIAKIRRAEDTLAYATLAQAFVERVCIPGDAARRISNYIATHI